MRRLPVVVSIVGLFGAGTQALAAEPLHLKATSPWLVDYAEDSCRAVRNFGDGDQQVVLFLDQFQPGVGFTITIGGQGLRLKPDKLDYDLKLRFGPDEREDDATAVTGTMGKYPALILSGDRRVAPLTAEEKSVRSSEVSRGARPSVPTVSKEREAAVRFLEILGVGDGIVLETGAMDKPLDVLRTCAWDTVGDWGLNVAQQQSLTRDPIARDRGQGWFTSRDYPYQMARGNYQGIVTYRLIVDETGKPKACHVQRSTRPKDFDETVCRVVMRRGSFQPALDSQGKPVSSFWSQTIVFRLEG